MYASLEPLYNTCSMYEISGLNQYDLASVPKFLKELNVLINEENEEQYDEDGEQMDDPIMPVRAIIYNSLLDNKSNSQLVKAGFEKVMSYSGNTNDKTVTTYIKLVNQ